MGYINDMKTVARMAIRARGDSHQERLESFYGPQAANYDAFRKRLLHGREELWNSIPIPQGGYWVDFGGGTGSNLETIAGQLDQLKQLDIVDLSTSLLEVAERRVAENGWRNVTAKFGDATVYKPDQLVDVVTFSYSLTMIPDWYLAIKNALRILKPGGTIAVVDFYISRKYASEGFAQHSAFCQWFWPTWFRRDNVYLSPDHLPYLSQTFDSTTVRESSGPLPFVPLIKVPHYQFLGKKVADTQEKDSRAKHDIGQNSDIEELVISEASVV